VARVPWGLGVVRQRTVATRIEPCCPPHTAQVLACGRGVATVLLAILDSPHALSQVGGRLEAHGRLPLLPPGHGRASRPEYRLGQRRDALVAAHLHRVLRAIALHSLEGYALATPGLPQATPTLTLYEAYEAETRPGAQRQHAPERPVPPRPAAGHRQEGRAARTQGLLRLGGSREGLPLRLGVRGGHTRDRPEPPGALDGCLALGRGGLHGIGADRQASWHRTRGVCRAKRVGLLTLGPRPCAVRQELAARGQQPGPWPR
jgi:hypothetical protein